MASTPGVIEVEAEAQSPLATEALADGPRDPRDGLERVGALGALRNSNYARYWSTLSVSMTGTWVRITAMGVLVYELTGDPFKLGLISFAQAAPELVAGPVAGAYLDRIDRRRVLVVVQIVQIAMTTLIAVLIMTGAIQFWHLMAIAIVVGTATGFDWPARSSLAPTLVQPAELQSAVALNAAAFNGSRVIGPTIAGWVIGGLGLASCFVFTSIAAVPFLLIVMSLTIVRPHISTATRDEGAFTTLIEGYRYIWRTPDIRGLLSVDIVPISLGMSYATMAPAIAKDVLGLPEGGLGWLLAAGGVGALTGTLLVAVSSNARRRGRLVIVGAALFGATLIVFGLSGSVWISFPAILVLGLFFAFYSTLSDTLVQTNVDEAYRGRVVAVQTMLWGLTPIGGLLAGVMASLIDVQWAIAINGMLILVYLAFLWFRTPVRKLP